MSKLPKPREGVWYKIIYVTQLGNYQWWEHEMFAKFIGPNTDGDIWYFSLRPIAGTQDFRREMITELYEQPHTTQPKGPIKRKRVEAPQKAPA